MISLHSFTILSFLLSVALALPTHPHPHHHDKRAALSVYQSCTKSNQIALTFDDGPYDHLRQISDAFTNAGAKATFFFNGNNWDCIYNANRMADIQYAYNAGHQLASHTWSHADLITLTTDQLHDTMYRMEEALSRIVGVKPAFMRPPYGSWNTDVRDVSFARGQNVVLWDWDTGDADGNSTVQSEAVYDQIVDSHLANAMVLEHEIVETTPTVLVPYAINLFQSHGYQLVTVAECLGLDPYAAIGIPQTPDSSWTCVDTPAPGQGCAGSIECKTGTPVLVTDPNPPSNPSGKPIHPNGNTSKCLTAPTNSDGTKLEITDCTTGAASQSWTVEGSVIKIYGDKCLDVTDGQATNGNLMQIWTCSTNNHNQEWTTSSSAIQWAGTSFCLDNKAGIMDNGNPTQLWTCRGNTNQIWQIGDGDTTPPPANQVIHPSASSSTCLTASSNSDGAAVVVQPCDSSASQSWKVSGSTLIVYGNKCLDVPEGNTANGVKMQIWTCSENNPNQQFTATDDHRISWNQNGNCLDLSGGSLASGNRVQMWARRDNNPNQIWYLV